MNCPNCHNEVVPGTKFCGECGTILPEPEPVEETVVEIPVEEAAEPVLETAAEPAEEVAAEPAEPVTTVYCPKCAQVNRVGDRFCMKCGNNLEGVEPSAQPPVVIAEANTMDKVEEFARKSAQKMGKLAKKGAAEAEKLAKKGAEEAKKLASEGSDKAKKLPKSVLFAIIGIAAVIVIVVGLLLVGAVFGGGKDNFAFYLKDSEIFYSDFSKKDPAEITDRLMNSHNVDADQMQEVASVVGMYVALTDQGERLFYPDKIGDDYGVTIYYRDMGKLKKDPVKLDSGITLYAVAKDGKEVVYLKGDEGDLYRNNLEEKEKIASDVKTFYITDDLKTVLYHNQDNNLYLLEKGGEKEKIASDVENLHHVAEDLSTVYYTKDGALYMQKIGKDRVKIDADVEDIAYILENGAFYYTVSETKEIRMMDFVADDLAVSDAAIEEPVYPEYPVYPYSWDYDSEEEYEAAYAEYESALAEYTMQEEAYWEKLDLYNAKENRDVLREDLKSYTEEITEYTLCYFNGKETEEVLTGVTSGWIDDYAFDAAVAMVKVYEEGEDIHLKLSEIESVWDVSSQFYEARNTAFKQYLVVGSASYEVELEDAQNLRISADGEHLTYIMDMDEEKAEGALYRAEIKKNGLGAGEKLNEDVYAGGIYKLADDSLVYFKDADLIENVGQLWIDGQEVDEDVCLSQVVYAEELGGVLYYTDWDEDDACGTLKLYKNKKSEKLSDDVYGYYINQSGELIYLYDYSSRQGVGSLYIYNGGKAKKIDDDVSALLPDYMLHEVMHGFHMW